MKYLIGIQIALLLIVIVLFIRNNQRIADFAVAQYRLKEATDSMVARDKRADSAIAAITAARTSDSLRLYGIEGDIARIPDILTDIKNRYDKKRDHIDSLPFDQQLEFFANWLPKDTTR